MEGFLVLIAVLIGLAVLLAPIGVLVLSRKTKALEARITQLEVALGAKGADQSPWKSVKAHMAERDELAEREDAEAQGAGEAVDDEIEQAPQTTAPQAPKAFVFRTETLAGAISWIKENWFLGVAALSLALAGVFMVQYGVEQGLLTPFARIMGALGLGAVLIAAGEVVRRRYGDESGSMRALPSTFSGAGIVTLFAAVLSARHLYDMLPSDLALLGLIAVALFSVALGWFYGPFLAVVGVLGALGAPFVVGGSSDAPHVFFYYFALIVGVALAIDTVRRWAWVSVLGLIGGFLATWALLLSGAAPEHALGFAILATLAATALPQRRIWPDHGGAMLSEVALRLRGKGDFDWPEFPTRIAAGTFIAALALCGVIVFTASNVLGSWLGIWSVAGLGVLALFWMSRAPALEDLSALAPLVLLALAVILGLDSAPRSSEEGALNLPAESVFIGIFALFAALGFWRASKGVRGTLIWIGASAFALPAMFGALELFWMPSQSIGAYAWAGHAMGAAALMTLLAERVARRWPADKRPAALYAICALSLVTFAVMLILSAAALNLAIAVMIVLTALLDRRYDMPWLGLFIQLAVAVLGWRVVIDPGVPWASWQYTPLLEVVLAYAGPLVLMALAWWILRPIKRDGAQYALESAIWAYGAVFALILLERAIRSDFDSFWGISLAGSVVLISMGAQLYRWRVEARFKAIRVVLASLMGVIGFGAVFIALIGMSPLTRWGARDVQGPLLLDTIAIGYLVPAAVLAVLVWKLAHVHRLVRAGFAAVSALLVASYIALEIRRYWQGSEIASHAVSQGELYSYTVAMMLGSVALLLLAFARRSDVLRKLAMAGIAVTIAKVFLLDMSGLTGLVRVASFLGLGLALTGLAWLNRAMSARWERASDE